jgi:hypothetical protein
MNRINKMNSEGYWLGFWNAEFFLKFQSLRAEILFRCFFDCVHSVNSVRLLRHPNDESQIEKQERRGEKQTVQKVQRAANSRQQIARILYVGAALDD